eukprot:gene1035-biopygen1112
MFLPPCPLTYMKLPSPPRISHRSLILGISPLLHQRQPIVYQDEDLRLWFSPSKKTPDLHLFSSDPHEELVTLIESGQVHMGCAVRASSLSLPLALCRPDGSCVLQFACVALLEHDAWCPSEDSEWYFASPERRSLLHQTLERWTHYLGIPPETVTKIQETLLWLSKSQQDQLPRRYWFHNTDVHHILRAYRRSVTLWVQPPGEAWSDWLVLDCFSDAATVSSRVTYSQLLNHLAPTRLHGALIQAHFSPWRAPEGLRQHLPRALRGLLTETMPGSNLTQLGYSTTVASIHGHPGVTIISPPRAPSPSLDLIDPTPSSLEEEPLDAKVPSLAASPQDFPQPAPAPYLRTSLLHLPGRPLTLADFPSPSPNYSMSSTPCFPYQRRFPPVEATPPDLTVGPCAPIGIWPSALARKRSSPEWHTALLAFGPTMLTHGYQPLQSTGGPFSVLTALLGTINHGPDTVLLLWKRAEVYVNQHWSTPDCYPTELVNIHTSHSVGSLRKKSLSSIAGLDFSYTPSLLEIFQRLCSTTMHPVMYFILAGAYSGPLQVIDITTSTVTWYQVDNRSSLLKRFPRHPYLTLLDYRGEIGRRSAPRPNPDAFELARHGLPGDADDFRVIFYNVNRLDGFKHAELLAFMSSVSVDCLVLIEARIPKHQARFCLRETRAELGPGAVCLVSSPTATSGSTDGSKAIKVGGNIIILNDRWGPALINFKSDPSGFCVADEILLASAQGRLQIIATYWPFPSSEASPEGMEGRVRRGLSHRLSTYLITSKSSATPLSYIQQWMHRHMTTPGGTEIDHVLHNSLTMTLTQYDTGAAGLWVRPSDHRPDFHAEAEANWVRLEGVPTSCHHAETQLSHLTDISLAASPSRKKWKVRNKYKEHWSPTYAALQAQLVAMIRLQRQLGVPPLHKHQPRWYTPLDVQHGISQITHAWESTVRSLTFPNGTPPEVWGTGLTPAEWRTQDVSNLHSLRPAALSTFKLLKSHLHARKRKELSIRVSVYIASREENILVSDMHAGIQSLLNEIPPNTPLEQLNFGNEDYTPRSPEELHTNMTTMFYRHFQSQPTPSPALHNARLSSEERHGHRQPSTPEHIGNCVYGCSWDMKKPLDSVSKPLILLCWQRLGVPLEIAQWLVDFDEAGFTIVRTPFAVERWDLHGLLGVQPFAFNPERGTGQGDIHSPFTWLAVFDVLLTMLEHTPPSEHHFILRKPDGSTYMARDICFLQSFGAMLEGLQRTADLVSTYAINLSIASHKLRAFHFRGLLQPPLEPLYI